MSHWPDIIEHIPDAITRAATTPYTPKVDTYVVFMPDEDSNEPHFYAKAEDNGAAGLKYHIQFIDTFGTPHDTGRYVSTMTPLNTQMAEAVTWIENKQEDAHYTFQNRNPQEDTDDDSETAENLYPRSTITSFPHSRRMVTHGPPPRPTIRDHITTPPYHQATHQALHPPRS